MLGSAGIYSDGSILSEKALKIAERLGCNVLKESNGWLNLWKKSYNVRQIKNCGKSGDVSGATIDSWKQRVLDIVQGYSAEDKWNLDETGCYGRALPDRRFNERMKACKGGKQSKQWITVTFKANANGASKAMPIEI